MKSPYTDVREERVREGIPYTYIHGGFAGTDVKFALCFPEKEVYEGRLFQ